MTTMQSKVFEALRAIDIPEEKALKASTALSKRDEDVASVKADLLVLKWVVGFQFALTGALLWIVLKIAVKLGALP